MTEPGEAWAWQDYIGFFTTLVLLLFIWILPTIPEDKDHE